MVSLLLTVIYLAFVSLGLPDALLGSALPVMGREIGLTFSQAGLVSMIICGGTVAASLGAERLTRRFGTALVTAASAAVSALSLLGFSAANSFFHLCLLAIPYGLAAGAVDAALNSFVALRYKSRHMNWLHCFWGVGATVSPYIMGYALGGGFGWRSGYFWVFLLQAGMTGILLFSLPVWKRVAPEKQAGASEKENFSLWRTACLPGVPASLTAFFCYCALETTTGLWATSFLVSKTGLNEENAAACTSLFFLGITLGRFLSGFVADRVGDRGMVRIGVCLMGLGTLLILVFPEQPILSVLGLLITGVGGAPYYPALIHSTPVLFGTERASAIMGLQMASAYVGSALAPPLFGILAEGFSLSLLPAYLLVLVLGMAILTERGWRGRGKVNRQ